MIMEGQRQHMGEDPAFAARTLLRASRWGTLATRRGDVVLESGHD